MVTDFFGANQRKLAYFAFVRALAFHKGWEDRNMDARINPDDDSSTSDKNLVNFDPVTSEFCRCVCSGRAARWSLPHISSCLSGRVTSVQFSTKARFYAVESPE